MNEPWVLIVEDEEPVASLWKSYLEDQGFRATIASGLRDAACALSHARPDAIVLDLSLPNGAGANVVRAVRSMAPDSPIVVATGLAEADLDMTTIRDGADEFVAKPIGLQDLLRKVLVAMVRREVREEFREARESIQKGKDVLVQTGS